MCMKNFHLKLESHYSTSSLMCSVKVSYQLNSFPKGNTRSKMNPIISKSIKGFVVPTLFKFLSKQLLFSKAFPPGDKFSSFCYPFIITNTNFSLIRFLLFLTSWVFIYVGRTGLLNDILYLSFRFLKCIVKMSL